MRFIVSISGYAGPATSLVGLIDHESGSLIVRKQIDFREGRKPGEDDVALVSNLALGDCDFRFTDQHLRDAVRSYFSRKNQGTLRVHDEIGLYAPEGRIQVADITANGPSYEINPDISNGQIAVLAAVAFFDKQLPLAATFAALDSMTSFYESFTI